MAKINKYIEIVRSTTPSLSSMGQKSCGMIKAVLEQQYQKVGVTFVSDTNDLDRLVNKQPDLVFLGVKNVPSEQDPESLVWVSDYLDKRGINYTGSTQSAIMLDFDKPAAKQIVRSSGLHSAAYFTAQPGQYTGSHDLPLNFPLFIKPPNGGGGKGIGADSVARNFVSYQQKVQSIYDKYGTESLVETYLPGREFSVAIIENDSNKELLAMPIELITEQNSSGDRILGQKVKSDDTEHVIAVAEGHIRQAVVQLAKDVFEVLGARDYGRIDIRLNENNEPHFLEANLIPGLAQHDFTSYFTSACIINKSMNYEVIIGLLAEIGLSHGGLYDATSSGSAMLIKKSLEPSLLTT